MRLFDSPLHRQPKMGQNILVLGGTGFLGRSLYRQLTAEGAHGGRVTVATRSLSAAQNRRTLPGLEVAQVSVRCLQSLESIGRVLECVGPKVYELIEPVRRTGDWSGHARRVLPIPRILRGLQALVLELMPGETLMSRDNLLSIFKPNIASALPTLKDLGIEASALESIAPQHLGGSRAA